MESVTQNMEKQNIEMAYESHYKRGKKLTQKQEGDIVLHQF